MKKTLATILALAFVLSMSVGAAAIGTGAYMGGGIGTGASSGGGIGTGATSGGDIGTGANPYYPPYQGPSGIATGDILAIDDSGYVSINMTNTPLVPGKTYFIALGPTAPDRRKATAQWSDSIAISSGQRARLASTSLNISKRKYHPSYGTSDWAYFIELPIADISSSQYDGSGYLLAGSLRAGAPYSDVSIQCTIAYEEGGSDITHTAQYFSFVDEEEVELGLPFGSSYILIDSRGVKTEGILSMNTDYDRTVANKYPGADIDFLNGNGFAFRRNAVMVIDARGYRYLYENNGGVLTDLTHYYDRGEDAFAFKTRTLGRYLLSDSRLRAEGSSTSTESHTPSSSTNSGGSGSSSGTVSTSSLATLVSTYYSNRFITMAYGQTYGALNSVVELQCKANFSGFNTKALHIYVYDQAKNNFLQLTNTSAKVDANGVLTFRTSVQGQFVITDSPLKAK